MLLSATYTGHVLNCRIYQLYLDVVVFTDLVLYVCLCLCVCSFKAIDISTIINSTDTKIRRANDNRPTTNRLNVWLNLDEKQKFVLLSQTEKTNECVINHWTVYS